MIFYIFGFIFVLTMGYFFLMFFFPEWVGISGEDTKKAIESHQGDSQETTSDENASKTLK
tara:strand:+ start:1546 stop:1725 length:180 start_codon:yes stop_codon:yes gene_type:complete